jgi:hypothetical protein
VTGTSRDLQAIEAVHKSSWLALTRLAYLLVGDRSEAEDIVQTVFVTAAPRSRSRTRRLLAQSGGEPGPRPASQVLQVRGDDGRPDWGHRRARGRRGLAVRAGAADHPTSGCRAGTLGSEGQGISVVNLDEPDSARTLIDGEEAIQGLTASPDGTKLAYGRLDGTRFNGELIGGTYILDVGTGVEENAMHGPGNAEWLDNDTLIVSN